MKPLLCILALKLALVLPHAVLAQESLAELDSKALTRLAEQGNADAQVALGDELLMYQNQKEATGWYMQAAQQNHPQAQYRLGVLHRGMSTAQSAEQARQWFERAAQQGHDQAQQALGFIYQYGRGVEQDMELAEHWYAQAAEQGNADAQQALGAIFAARQDYAKAHYWFELSAEQGHPLALTSLGGLYEHGEGVKQDKARARALYEQVCEAGQLIGCDKLENLGK
ncbi:hypothetical protein CO608_10090 [Lysobacteraceae bacterium NML08-0793]|nr:hypothetical protein CO608_10090 [Xanthomonadaceae bacterium NML08-0793]